MTERYTAADFENAQFAKHENGRLSHKTPNERWAMPNDKRVPDSAMSEEGWVPVPTKPTITETELYEECGFVDNDYSFGFKAGFHRAGGKVIPDPEPTNTEKLAALIKEVQGVNYGWIAKHLNDHGVTAPKVKDN